MASDYRNNQTLPRGIRNNNPGNIKVGDSWKGMVGDDGTFIIFQDMSWGTRALGQSLINMINKGNDSIDSLIRTWSATDQDAYVANVSSYTGIDPNAQLSTDPATIAALIRAIANQENGTDFSTRYVSDQDIQDGIAKINSGLITALQAIPIDAINYPVPYLIGGILLVLGLQFFFGKRGK